uniref:Regulator of microtubule dynamics protein 1 n=1 Tax=Sinocyclocheilus rhinocerous TaxID=307959 RepID=A0A673LHF3_9TELE
MTEDRFCLFSARTQTSAVYLSVRSDDAAFLWRLARASRDLALLSSISADEKKRLTYEAFDYAKKALEKNQACFAAHKWFAICLSDVGDYEGIKVKIGNSYTIRNHLEQAIELNPKDATSIHILGYWCFAFSELAWYQRKVAAVIFASPPTATYEEALAFFLKAEEVDPNFYSKNLLMLGKTYMMLRDVKRAALWLTKARDYPAVTEEDKQVRKHSQIHLLYRLQRRNVHVWPNAGS